MADIKQKKRDKEQEMSVVLDSLKKEVQNNIVKYKENIACQKDQLQNEKNKELEGKGVDIKVLRELDFGRKLKKEICVMQRQRKKTAVLIASSVLFLAGCRDTVSGELVTADRNLYNKLEYESAIVQKGDMQPEFEISLN